MDTGLIGRDLTALSDQRISRPAFEAGLRLAFLARRGDGGALTVDPWSTFDAFRIGPRRKRTVQLDVGGTLETIEYAWSAAHGRDEVEPVLVNAGRLAFAGDAGHERHATVVPDGRVFVSERGRCLSIAWPTYEASGIDADDGDGASVRAPINGRVAKIFVAAGETVEKGARVAVVEAMKMEHVLVAQVAGTIDKVAASEGAQVTQGTVIATIAAA
jgi:3-methylcrotonyl-CoA carboxylase alpha subunit